MLPVSHSAPLPTRCMHVPIPIVMRTLVILLEHDPCHPDALVCARFHCTAHVIHAHMAAVRIPSGHDC